MDIINDGVECVIKQLSVFASTIPVDDICKRFYERLKVLKYGSLLFTTADLRMYKPKNLIEEEIKLKLLFYLDIHNSEVK